MACNRHSSSFFPDLKAYLGWARVTTLAHAMTIPTMATVFSCLRCQDSQRRWSSLAVMCQPRAKCNNAFVVGSDASLSRRWLALTGFGEIDGTWWDLKKSKNVEELWQDMKNQQVKQFRFLEIRRSFEFEARWGHREQVSSTGTTGAIAIRSHVEPGDSESPWNFVKRVRWHGVNQISTVVSCYFTLLWEKWTLGFLTEITCIYILYI